MCPVLYTWLLLALYAVFAENGVEDLVLNDSGVYMEEGKVNSSSSLVPSNITNYTTVSNTDVNDQNKHNDSSSISSNSSNISSSGGKSVGLNYKDTTAGSPRYTNDKNDHNRTAVILSGQLRSANLTWTSGKIMQNINSRMFGKDDPQTTALTIIEFLFKPLAQHGGLDVFMYQTARPETLQSYDWDGDPYTFEPRVGDPTVCKVFADEQIFGKGTGNHFFCMVEPERKLMTPFIKNFTSWHTYTYGKSEKLKEQVLAQLHGIYQGNLAAKQYAIEQNINYKYKVRLRPDTAIVKPFPLISTMDFSNNGNKNCIGHILFANKHIYKSGNEDWFNMGLTEHMDKLLDRYIDFISTPFVHNSHKSWWDLENHLMGLMNDRYKICMKPNDAIWMVVIRKVGHKALEDAIYEPEENPYSWQDLSGDKVILGKGGY